MAEPKTKPTAVSVEKFVAAVKPEQRREECLEVIRMMKKATRAEPVMWGPSIVGFGKYHYEYASGHSGDSPIVGFSPRKTALTLYIMPGFDKYEALLAKLGKFKTGRACLYLAKLTDVDSRVLQKLIEASVADMKKRK